jgi:hypothetical protein
VVIGIVAARWIAGPRHGGDLVEPVAEVETSVTTPLTSLPPAVTTTSLLSEADLRADVTWAGGGEQLAVMRAEWFITDYFTVDGAEHAVEDLHDAFVEGAQVPALPHEDPAVTGTTYVEWARAFGVTAVATDLYSVAVAFRSIYHDGDVFRRSPVRAAEVLVTVGDDRSGIAELPIPIPAPLSSQLSIAPPPGGEPPPGVTEAALDYAWIFDPEPELLSATGTATDWRVVIGLHDGSGITFPVAIRPSPSVDR